MEGGLVVAVMMMGVLLGGLILFSRFFRKVSQGQALVRNGIGGTRVSFNGMMVIPVAHHFEYVDISVKRIEIERMAAEALMCRDGVRADMKVAFLVHVNKRPEDVVLAAQSIGRDHPSTLDAIRVLFEATFAEALVTAAKRFDFAQVNDDRDAFKSEVMKSIGTYLHGFVIDDFVIAFLEKTPVRNLDT